MTDKISEEQIEMVLRSVKGSFAIEGLVISPELEELGRRVLRGETFSLEEIFACEDTPT